MLATLELTDTGTFVRPGQGTFNIPNARVLAPHDPYRSVLLYRTATLGPGRMPRLGSTEVDEVGVQLLHDWIAQLPGVGFKVVDADAAAIKGESVERLPASTSGALRLAQELSGGKF